LDNGMITEEVLDFNKGKTLVDLTSEISFQTESMKIYFQKLKI